MKKQNLDSNSVCIQLKILTLPTVTSRGIVDIFISQGVIKVQELT